MRNAMEEDNIFDNQLKKQLMSNLHHPSFADHLERYILANQMRLLRIMAMNLDAEIIDLIATKNKENEAYVTGRIDVSNEISDQCVLEIMKMIDQGGKITKKIREMDEKIPWTI